MRKSIIRRHLRMDRIRAKRHGEVIRRWYMGEMGHRMYAAMPDGSVEIVYQPW